MEWVCKNKIVRPGFLFYISYERERNIFRTRVAMGESGDRHGIKERQMREIGKRERGAKQTGDRDRGDI